MRYFMLATLVAMLASFDRASAQADVDPEAKKILDRAAKALGGQDKLAQYRGVQWKGKGKFRQADIAVEFDGEAYVADVDRFRQDLSLGANQGTVFTLVVTGTKSWVKTEKIIPLPPQLAPLRANFYALALVQKPHLLTQKMFELSVIGEVEVAGRPTLALRVNRKGWPEVSLFYDKANGLPVKSEVRVKDPTTAQEASDEFFVSEYQSFDGLLHFTRMVGKRNGDEYLERNLTDIRWHERLADDLFEMP